MLRAESPVGEVCRGRFNSQLIVISENWFCSDWGENNSLKL